MKNILLSSRSFWNIQHMRPSCAKMEIWSNQFLQVHIEGEATSLGGTCARLPGDEAVRSC